MNSNLLTGKTVKLVLYQRIKLSYHPKFELKIFKHLKVTMILHFLSVTIRLATYEDAA